MRLPEIDVVVAIWGRALAAVERGDLSMDDRRLSILWYVAGIAYERDNAPLLSDRSYDLLSVHLCGRINQARAAGADLLSEEDLRAGTAMNWRSFPAYAHRIADTLKGRLTLAKIRALDESDDDLM